jgi:hypothetical protein
MNQISGGYNEVKKSNTLLLQIIQYIRYPDVAQVKFFSSELTRQFGLIGYCTVLYCMQNSTVVDSPSAFSTNDASAAVPVLLQSHTAPRATLESFWLAGLTMLHAVELTNYCHFCTTVHYYYFTAPSPVSPGPRYRIPDLTCLNFELELVFTSMQVRMYLVRLLHCTRTRGSTGRLPPKAKCHCQWHCQ